MPAGAVRLLALDGGGFRGLLSLMILRRLRAGEGRRSAVQCAGSREPLTEATGASSYSLIAPARFVATSKVICLDYRLNRVMETSQLGLYRYTGSNRLIVVMRVIR